MSDHHIIFETKNNSYLEKQKSTTLLSLSFDDLSAYSKYKTKCIQEKKSFLKPLEWLKEISIGKTKSEN
jgi:hypothetical protein